MHRKSYENDINIVRNFPSKLWKALKWIIIINFLKVSILPWENMGEWRFLKFVLNIYIFRILKWYSEWFFFWTYPSFCHFLSFLSCKMIFWTIFHCFTCFFNDFLKKVFPQFSNCEMIWSSFSLFLQVFFDCFFQFFIILQIKKKFS